MNAFMKDKKIFMKDKGIHTHHGEIPLYLSQSLISQYSVHSEQQIQQQE